MSSAEEPATKKQRLPEPSSTPSESADTASPSKTTDTPGKKSVAGTYEGHCLITNFESGIVIGTRGSNVKSLRARFNVFINISEVDGQGNRVMKVKGKPEDVAATFPQVAEVLLGAERDTTEDCTAATELSTSAKFTLRLLVHHLQAGCIIGQGGSIVKEISKTTGAQISVSTHPFQGSTDKQVTVIGAPANLLPACQAIYAQLVKNPLSAEAISTQIPYLSRDHMRALAMQGGGSGAPPGGPGGGFRGPAGPRGGGFRGPAGPPHGGPGYGGPRNQPAGPPPPPRYTGPDAHRGIPGALPYYPPLPPEESFRPSFQGSRSGPSAAAAPASGSIRPGLNDVVETMQIPVDMSGAVLGKSGSIVKEIKQMAGIGTRISLGKPGEGKSTRDVTVCGTSRAVRIAMDLIQLRLDYPMAAWPPPQHMMPASLSAPAPSDPSGGYPGTSSGGGPYPGYNPIPPSGYVPTSSAYSNYPSQPGSVYTPPAASGYGSDYGGYSNGNGSDTVWAGGPGYGPSQPGTPTNYPYSNTRSLSFSGSGYPSPY
eukprot:gb/GEZN01001266.1/.p1 GENE.gb/GEZN01001266.1/~~gb/GEZN01001266.1/.p1  ORF type:complete len:540 (-),score=40.18 gb/GEZN01001266.1/:1464-3083(-)